MRIGCATWLLGVEKMLEAVRAACDAGLAAVSFIVPPQEVLPADGQRELNRFIEDYDLLATMHTGVGRTGDAQWPPVPCPRNPGHSDQVR